MREYSTPAQFTVGDDESVVRTVFVHAEKTPHRVMFSRPEGENDWVAVTASQFAEQVSGVAKGLIANGVQPGDRVALLSATRYEWSLFDYAIWAAGAVSVPIYDSSSTDQIHWILQDSEAALAVVETARHEALFVGMPETLRRIVQIDGGAVDTLIAEGAGVDDAELQARLEGIRADDLASLVYTSGTTGRPKGCILTHRNFLSEVRAILTSAVGAVAKPGNRGLTFLPLAHVLARAVALALFESGTAQSHWSDFSSVSAQFERYSPNIILGVPRVFEKVRDAAAGKAAAGGKLTAAIFRFAEETAVAYSESLDQGGPSLSLKAKRTMADKLVYAKLRAAMGNDCWYAISGGGALSPKLGHFFRGVGVPIYEGYGLTESTAAHSVNTPGAQKIGSVGQPMGGNSTRIAEDGEIELRGGVIFQGYWRNEKATEEVFRDGWFRTGDLGEIDEDGYVYITGRKKDLIVTAGGKNVSPGQLEDRMRSHTLVSQAVVIGDGRAYITALLTVDPDVFDNWKAENGKPATATIAQLRHDPSLRDAMQSIVDDANSTVSHAEAIKKFVILDRDLTEATGELTPTLKIKRNVVTERFAEDIEGMYAR
ncbi:AMP-dependent synthetase/ligase [Rhodococcus zopfii]|uniref:AMP-dependent synthetase/ligase n=1 Tax=Rhodococcus zopfii TaxID=43772 RepID=UPI0011113793|nr:long-chain fatty acid--CoA ligase [Rhodococcus zopfii]